MYWHQKEVRERFKGPVSYDSVRWGMPVSEYKRVKWWDALDYIATDFWFSLTSRNYVTTHKDKGAKEDLQEQADCYQAAMEVLWNRP